MLQIVFLICYTKIAQGAFLSLCLVIIKLWLLCFQLLRTDDKNIHFYKNDQIGFNNTSYILFNEKFYVIFPIPLIRILLIFSFNCDIFDASYYSLLQ